VRRSQFTVFRPCTMSSQASMGSYFSIVKPYRVLRLPPQLAVSPLQREKRKNIHPIQAYLWKFTGCDKLPRVDETGIPYLAPKSTEKAGRASRKNRTLFNTEKELRKHLDVVMPNYPSHVLPTPPILQRATKHRVGEKHGKGPRGVYDTG